MKPDIHDHLFFGEGVVDFRDVFDPLKAIGYRGLASVELSRHSHDAVNVARRSLDFLTSRGVHPPRECGRLPRG
jgi:sugar phosphate isomerase/epimerase